MNEAKNIIIHCSATPNGREHNAEQIRHWHTDPKPEGNGWKKAGYQFVIPLTGDVEPLVLIDDDEFIEPWEIANGARGHNHNSIHICLIGTDKFTSPQWDALAGLLSDLTRQFPGATIHGHREFNSHKSCPGFDVQAWLENPVAIEAKHILEQEE